MALLLLLLLHVAVSSGVVPCEYNDSACMSRQLDKMLEELRRDSERRRQMLPYRVSGMEDWLKSPLRDKFQGGYGGSITTADSATMRNPTIFATAAIYCCEEKKSYSQAGCAPM